MSMPIPRQRTARAIQYGGILVVTAVVLGCGDAKDEPISAAKSQYEVEGRGETAVTPPAGELADRAAPPRTRPGQEDPNGKTKYPSADFAADPSPVAPSPKLAELKVPEGKDELLAFLDKVDQRFDELRTGRVEGMTMDALQREVIQTVRLKLEASDRLLAIDDLDQESRGEAIQSKLLALSMLSRFGQEDANEEMEKFANDLIQDPEFANQGRMILLGRKVDQLATGQTDDPEAVLEDLEKILEDDDLGRPEFTSLRQASLMLLQVGQLDAGKKALRMVRDKFADSADESLAREAAEIDQQLDFVAYKETWQKVAFNEDGDLDKLAETAVKVVQNGPDVEVFSEMASDALNLEFSSNLAGAKILYDLIREHYAGSDNEEVAERATAALANADKRLGLIGKPFEITGATLEGEPLDWSDFEGKVVLVDFWATWCGPCRAEFPNMEENYTKYHDKGFEIVGVNLDDERQAVTQFLADQPLPWVTVRSPNPEEAGFNDPNVVKAGVEAIPFLVLVGQDGNVVALHTRGQQLGEKLAELLEPANDAPEADPAPAADETGQAAEPIPAATETAASQRSHDVFVAFFDRNAERDDADEDGERPNAYLAPAGLSESELVDYLLDMDEKPRTIQSRPGFAAAVVDAADRLLSTDAKDKSQIIAAEAKFQILHRDASLGDEKADQALMAFVDQMKDDARERIAKNVRFFQLERKVIDAEKLAADRIPDLLAEVKEYMKDQKLTARHLRLASSVVRAINQLADGDEREEYFAEFGSLFSKSDDKQLAGYGTKLSKPPSGPSESQLVGKPLELDGVTALGLPFDWASYRGKVVLVDFWATWCGPCRREMPHMRELYDRLNDRGFDVVAVNLDQDEEALARYLEENEVPWVNLVGEPSRQLAQRYGVRGIPTMLLVDREGNIVATSHQVATLVEKAESLLDAEPKAAN